MNDLAYLIRQMKAPRIAPRPGPRGRQAVSHVAEQARNENWTYEDFLTTLLEQEVVARQAQGGEARIRAAHFPARKTVEPAWRQTGSLTLPTKRACASRWYFTWPPCPSSKRETMSSS
jgi:hypothetical protein